jgi:hypothetical protein
MNETTNPATATAPGSASLLRDRFDHLRAAGLKDLKFWFRGASEETTVDSLCDEVMSILDAHEQERFVDLGDKLK